MNDTKRTDIELAIDCLDMHSAIHATFFDIIGQGLNKKGFSEATSNIAYYVYKMGQNPYLMSITEFTQKSGILNKNLTYVLDRLEKCGYLHRENPMADKRTRLIGLTDKGRELFEAINEVMGTFITKTGLSGSLINTMHNALTTELTLLKRYYLNT